MAIFNRPELVEVDDGEIIEWVKKNYTPDDVFSFNKLSDWAETNGYIKEEK